MRVIKEVTNKCGKRVITLEVDDNEALMVFSSKATYRLGYPLEDIIYGSAIIESNKVEWDQLEQRWLP